MQAALYSDRMSEISNGHWPAISKDLCNRYSTVSRPVSVCIKYLEISAGRIGPFHFPLLEIAPRRTDYKN